jgi:hypothetical protein
LTSGLALAVRPAGLAGVRSWINEWKKDSRPFAWTKTADEILETPAACCQRINDTGEPA